VENGLHVFHRSHRAWKTRQTTPSFPQFPQPRRLDRLIKQKDKKTNPLRAETNSYGQAANETVKTTRPGRLSMAGFEVTIYGRFSGDQRGNAQCMRISFRFSFQSPVQLTNYNPTKYISDLIIEAINSSQ
jgi:hypothetical protein